MSGTNSNSRSLGQILEKACVLSRGHIFDPIFLKIAQNVHIDQISIPVEYGWGQVKK